MIVEVDPGLLPSTDDPSLPAALRAARRAAGYSLARMAGLTHFSKPYLGLVETGRRAVTADLVARYEQVLGVSIGAVADPLRAAHEWLIADPPTACHLRAGHTIGGSLLSKLEDRVVQLRHFDDTVASRQLLPVVTRELDEAGKLARTAFCTDAHGRRLRTVVAELAQLAGWVASDAGHHRQAEQLYLSGLSAADANNDRALGAQLLSSLAYQIANVGDRADALLLARTAVKGAPQASPVVRALLVERLAWAAARTGDTYTTRRVLDAVDDAYDQRTDGIGEPEWVYWLDRTEIDVMAARCLIELGQPDQAEPLLTRALAGYQADHVREIALYRTWLAEGHAKAGNLDAATAVLDQITTRPDLSARLQRRVTTVRTLIQRRAGHRRHTNNID